MKVNKLQMFSVLLASTFTPASFACSDIFINQPNAHIEARSMDFAINIANEDIFGFIGQKNTTDVVIDADKVPTSQLTSWTNKYGYWARTAFNTPKVDDGMNTHHLPPLSYLLSAQIAFFNPLLCAFLLLLLLLLCLDLPI